MTKKIDNGTENLLKGSGQKLYKKAKNIIPGGTQLLSKRPELFAPDLWPSYYSKASGCYLWDLDGKKYLDMSIMSVGACTLGYADEDIDKAVIASINNGVSSSLNCPEEVTLAEKLIELHPWFDMVRYARGGGEAVSIAIRIARAKTKKDIILFNGYHGWSDWYIAANLQSSKNLDSQLMPGLSADGVPKGLEGSALPFNLNDLDTLKETVMKFKDKIAAIIIEPARADFPCDENLSALREIADSIGAILIYDEITTGFRVCTGGIHRTINTKPDIAILAKGMANGYPISVIMGNEKVMSAAQGTFISSTNWTDRVGPTAALATIKKFEENNVAESLMENGNKVKKIWKDSAKKYSIDITTSGIPSLPSFSFNSEDNQKLLTQFTIEMLKDNILGFRQFKPSYAHDEEALCGYERSVLSFFKRLSDGKIPSLDTEKAHSGFFRLAKE